MLTEYFKVCSTHVLQVDIHPLGSEAWYKDNRQRCTNEIHGVLRDVIDARIPVTVLRRRANKGQAKHTTAKLPAFTKPTMLNGPTLRIAYSFKPRTRCSTFLLLANFSARRRGKEFISFEFLTEKLVVYALPIDSYRDALRSGEISGLRCVQDQTRGQTALVSDYFSAEGTGAREGNCTNHRQALKSMMKKSKKRKRSGYLKQRAEPNISEAPNTRAVFGAKPCEQSEVQYSSRIKPTETYGRTTRGVVDSTPLKPTAGRAVCGDDERMGHAEEGGGRSNHTNSSVLSQAKVVSNGDGRVSASGSHRRDFRSEASGGESHVDCKPTTVASCAVSAVRAVQSGSGLQSSDSGTDAAYRRKQRKKRAQLLQNIAREIADENSGELTAQVHGAESRGLDSKRSEMEFHSTGTFQNKDTSDPKMANIISADVARSKCDTAREGKFKFRKVGKLSRVETTTSVAAAAQSKTEQKTKEKSDVRCVQTKKRKYGLDLSSEDEDFTKNIKKKKSKSEKLKTLKSRETEDKSRDDSCKPGWAVKTEDLSDKSNASDGPASKCSQNGSDLSRKPVARSNTKADTLSSSRVESNTRLSADLSKLYNAAKAHCTTAASSDPIGQTDCDVTESKPMEAEDIFSDCFIMEQLCWTPSKHDPLMERDIENIKKVCDLTEAQLEYLVLRNEYYLRQIFQGKVYNRRHEDYKHGGKARVNLTYQINIGLFKEAQQDTVMETLLGMFCKKHNKYFDYTMRVMLPEILIKIYMDVHHVTHEQTEAEMSNALATKGAIFK